MYMLYSGTSSKGHSLLGVQKKKKKPSVLRIRFLVSNYTLMQFKPLKRGNLPIKDAGPKMSFTWRFHCNASSRSLILVEIPYPCDDMMPLILLLRQTVQLYRYVLTCMSLTCMYGCITMKPLSIGHLGTSTVCTLNREISSFQRLKSIVWGKKSCP